MPGPRPTGFPAWMKWIEGWVRELDTRIFDVGARPGAVLIEATDTEPPPNTPVNAVVFKKGVGVIGWWDGSSVVPF